MLLYLYQVYGTIKEYDMGRNIRRQLLGSNKFEGQEGLGRCVIIIPICIIIKHINSINGHGTNDGLSTDMEVHLYFLKSYLLTINKG